MSEDEKERPYDIVVFGSTGYTGKFVAEEVYRVQCEARRSLRWAAAGRSSEKVRACLEGKRHMQRERESEREITMIAYNNVSCVISLHVRY